MSRQPSTDSQASSLVIDQRPDGANNYSIMASGRRHSNVTNGSLGFIPSLSPTSNIKPTGSLELGYIDKNPNQTLTIENYNYFKNNRNGVRRIRSTALETCCPAPSTLEVHPNSLEIICANHKNPALPPPSSSLIRNQHFSLCPHFSYGSEIVYPIAEQSDEHQTSHGPDTDVESIQHNSDSDYEENNTGSRSPLLYRLENVECVKMIHTVPSAEKELRKMCRFKENIDNSKTGYIAVQKQSDSDENGERTSANSKEALLENENSNSSATPEMQDAQLDCYATDNEYSDKKYSECSLCTDSNTSLDKDETVIELGRTSTVKLKTLEKNVVLLKDSDRDNKNSDGVKRRTGVSRRNKNSSNGAKALEEPGNCSSLMGLDWLFERNEDSQQKGNIYYVCFM